MRKILSMKACGDGVIFCFISIISFLQIHLFSDDKEMTQEDRKYAKILYKSQ
jgi:hypothetical protein